MRGRVLAACSVLLVGTAACANDALEPQPLDVGRQTCAHCRMTVSQSEFAGQLIVSGEVPLFFDDLGCLAAYLAGADPSDSTDSTDETGPLHAIYVMDHSSKTWLPALSAVFGRVATLATPMGSHLVAHASLAAKDADTDMTGWTPAMLDDVVPPRWRSSARPEGRQ
ncbi:MAG: hypothetical protein HQ485_14870 [Acidobacteria bacterium]|nr:hypothetical protein [Acidobacteriota bacterium]